MWGMREKSGGTTKQEQLEHNIKADVKFEPLEDRLIYFKQDPILCGTEHIVHRALFLQLVESIHVTPIKSWGYEGQPTQNNILSSE